MDLSEWLESGRVRALLDLVEELPAASRLYEAVANDPQEAEQLALTRMENRDDGPEWSPRVSEFTLTALLLRDAVNELKSVRRAIIATNGGKPGQEKPVPSPRTAVDEAFERLEDALSNELLGQFGFGPEDF